MVIVTIIIMLQVWSLNIFQSFSAYQEIFVRRKINNIDILSGQYNYNSIMHSSRYAYGTNGQVTMVAKHEPNRELGGMKLNQLDIMNLKLYYHCGREWRR